MGARNLVMPWLGGAVLFALCLQALNPASATPPDSDIQRTHLTSSPVVINEVAWGGTAASTADEWIELQNVTGYGRSLDGWILEADDRSPCLELTGHIEPYGYYLIERTDDETVSDYPADLIAPFGTGLSNQGEQLRLINAEGQIMDTVNQDGGLWPNDPDGASPAYRSMERLAPTASDLDSNWVSNDAALTSGRDANGSPIAGTPGAINAAFFPRYAQHSDLVVTQNFTSPVQAGALITLQYEIVNAGGYTATQVVLTNTLPLSTEFHSQSSEGAVFDLHDAHTPIWLFPEIEPVIAAPQRVTLTIRTDPSLVAGTPLPNHIIVTTATPELRDDNDISTATILIRSEMADLSLRKSGPSHVSREPLDTPLVYELEFHNRGPDIAYHTLLTDVLPTGLTFVTQTGAYPFTATSSLVTWYLGTLSPGSAQSVTLVAEVTEPLSTPLTNQAKIAARTPDPDLTNNEVSWETAMGQPRALISSVFYDGYELNDADEAIGITNLGPGSLQLEGWSLCEDRSGEIRCDALPPITVAESMEAWIARNGDAFSRTFGFPSDAEAPVWSGFANTGDEILLTDEKGETVDTLVYKSGVTTVPGWSGSPVEPFYNHLREESGQILHRILDERTRLPISDTDTVWDWIQNPDDPLRARRVLYPGWDLHTLFAPLSITSSASITLAIAPDHAFEALAEIFERAEESIQIEVYTLRHPALAELLAGKAAEGVHVEVLLEGNPVGLNAISLDWQTELHACERIESQGGEVWFMVHRPDDGIHNRYTYLHPKLAIVDRKWIVISTQNLTYSGLPSDDKQDGTGGSRGALIITDAPAVVQRGLDVVAFDLDPRHHNDLERWDSENHTYGSPNTQAVDLSQPNWTSYTVRFPEPLSLSGTYQFELFTAPEAALRQTDALLGLIGRAGAGHRVDVELTYEHVAWGLDPEQTPNLRLQAYIEAARRGAAVRILLNGLGFVEGSTLPPAVNLETLAYVRQVARAERLDLETALGNPTGEGIHNKMILVDLGIGERYIHLGSLNGSETSNKINREIALQLRSDGAYAYLQQVFAYDWWSSRPIYLPLMMKGYTPPPPAVDHLVISEVYYASDAESEWVEIFNPTDSVVDVSGYRLGDAETPETYEAMFRFPNGILLPPESTAVIAVNSTHVPEATLEFYDHASDIPDMLPVSDWGDLRYPFALKNTGDQVLLLNPQEQILDVVLWGEARFGEVVPHPGVVNLAASLSRYPPVRDTDDCAEDFRETYPPTPGAVTEMMLNDPIGTPPATLSSFAAR